MVNSSSGMDQLYRSHQQWLNQWLCKKIGNSQQAEDLVQDTFVKVLQTRDTLLGMNQPRAYLTTIARNLMIDYTRRRRIEQAYIDELEQMVYLVEAIPSPEHQIMLIEAIDQICKVLSHVSEKAQKAFLLHYFEGCTHKEIALQLNVSVKMIQKYLIQCLVQCYRIQHHFDKA